MPISYVDDISDGSGAFIFIKILTRWKGSLYKLVWVDLSVYILIYYMLNLSYRFLFTASQKATFESVVQFCEGMKGNIPVSFLLGFFVSGVIGRWYQMYMYIPWMNHISYITMSYVNAGDKEIARKIRISLMRYLNLSWILLMRMISDQISDRFQEQQQDDEESGSTRCCAKSGKSHKQQYMHPWNISQLSNTAKSPRTSKMPLDVPLVEINRQSMVPSVLSEITHKEAVYANAEMYAAQMLPSAFEGEDEWSIRATLQGFNRDRKVCETFGKIITEEEIKAFELVAKDYFKRTRQRYSPEYWVPLQWAVRLVQKAGLHGHISDPKLIGIMLNEVGTMRNNMQILQVYSSIMMPLVYTQVVIIAVYSFFACQIMASQFIEVPKKSGDPVIDFYIPLFSIFYFLFLMGWLKVALCVMNPFGDDDEDFETSAILDYNLDVSYRSVLMAEDSFPETLKAATFSDAKMKGVEDDNLGEFLRYTETEMSKPYVIPENNELKNLELSSQRCDCAKSGLCCGKRKKTYHHTRRGHTTTEADYKTKTSFRHCCLISSLK